jgi:hypothetical protein
MEKSYKNRVPPAAAQHRPDKRSSAGIRFDYRNGAGYLSVFFLPIRPSIQISSLSDKPCPAQPEIPT